jgi:signal peptidase II
MLSVMLAGLCTDLSTKSWSFKHVASQQVQLDRSQLLSNPNWSPIPQHDGKVAIPGRILNFRLVLNDGAVFGIGSQQRGFFILFTIAALGIAGWIFSKHTFATNTLSHVAIGCVLGGGLGNLYDRIFVGRVRDFMHLFPDRHLPFEWSWPGGNAEIFPWIFNAGDVLLLCGMGLLMVYFWKQPNPQQNQSDNS